LCALKRTLWVIKIKPTIKFPPWLFSSCVHNFIWTVMAELATLIIREVWCLTEQHWKDAWRNAGSIIYASTGTAGHPKGHNFKIDSSHSYSTVAGLQLNILGVEPYAFVPCLERPPEQAFKEPVTCLEWCNIRPNSHGLDRYSRYFGLPQDIQSGRVSQQWTTFYKSSPNPPALLIFGQTPTQTERVWLLWNWSPNLTAVEVTCSSKWWSWSISSDWFWHLHCPAGQFLLWQPWLCDLKHHPLLP